MIFKAAETVFGLPRRICSNIREAFQVAELILMIRATRGRSMDGWMDGEDLIICLAAWTLNER